MVTSYYLLRSTALRKCLGRNFNNYKPVTMKFFHFSSKPPRVLKPLIPHRNHYWISGLMGKQTEITLKNMDKISNDVQMIYRHDDLDINLKWLYLIACGMCCMVIITIALNFDDESHKFILDEDVAPSQRQIKYESVMALYFFSLCFLAFHGCMKRLPVRIYKIPKTDKYVFIFNGSIPLTTRKLVCVRGQCVKVDPNNYSSFIPTNSLYKIIKEQKVFLFDKAFKTPADLHILLGQQEEYQEE